MVLLTRLVRVDDEDGNAYLRSRGARAPEKLSDKYRSQGIVYSMPDNLGLDYINAVFFTSVGPRSMRLECAVSQDKETTFAYLSQDDYATYFREAPVNGVAI